LPAASLPTPATNAQNIDRKGTTADMGTAITAMDRRLGKDFRRIFCRRLDAARNR
jgi:hypothetical protein